MSKELWYGKFNYQGEIHEMYCKAQGKRHAFQTFCYKLAQELKLSSWSVRNYFWETNKYELKREESTQKTI